MANQPASASAPASADFRLARLKTDSAGFGALVDYLSRSDPFARYELGNFSRALQHQIASGKHLAAFSDGRLIGYCGWLLTTHIVAEAWLANKGPVVANDFGDTAVITVAAARDRRVLRALVRGVCERLPQGRVYFKRDYAGGQRAARKSSVVMTPKIIGRDVRLPEAI